MGAGHDAAARLLADRLRRNGDEAWVVDLLACLPLASGAAIRGFYAGMLRWAPWLYDAIYDHMLEPPHATVRPDPVAIAALPALRRILTQHRPDAVVATWHVAAQAVGRLRGNGWLTAPTTIVVTELAVHQAWVHPANDRHLCVHPSAAAEAVDRGAADPIAAAPLVADAYREPPPPGLPDGLDAALSGRTPVLVAAGEWGAGEVADTAREVAADPAYAAVVLCGRNERLARRLTGLPGVTPLGWRDDVPRLLASAQAVVQNGGGLACWEALALGRPVVTYRPLPGHGRAAAQRLTALGLADWPADAAGLRRALNASDPAKAPRLDLAALPDPAGLIAG